MGALAFAGMPEPRRVSLESFNPLNRGMGALAFGARPAQFKKVEGFNPLNRGMGALALLLLTNLDDADKFQSP